MEIVDFQYEDEVLKYKLIKTEGNKEVESWVNARDKIDKSLIRNFWKRKNDEQKAKRFEERYEKELPIPSKLLKVKEINNITYILTRFPTMDVPVYVPIYVLFNLCPVIVNKFLENELLDSSEIMDGTSINTIKSKEKMPDHMVVSVVPDNQTRNLSILEIKPLKVKSTTLSAIKNSKTDLCKNSSEESSDSDIAKANTLQAVEEKQEDEEEENRIEEEEYIYEEEEEYVYEDEIEEK